MVCPITKRAQQWDRQHTPQQSPNGRDPGLKTVSPLPQKNGILSSGPRRQRLPLSKPSHTRLETCSKMLRTGFNHTDHGSSVPPHPKTLVGHVSPLTFSPKYRAVPGISNAILAAFAFIIVFEAVRQ